jgi:ATP-binding cassette, subfamily B, bacterial
LTRQTDPPPPHTRHAYGRLLPYARCYGGRWLAIAGVTVLSTLFSLLQPWPLKVLIDHVLGDQPMSPAIRGIVGLLPGSASTNGLLVWVVIGGIAVFAVNSVAEIVLTLEWTKVGRRMVYDLARDLFANIQRRSLIFHSRHPVGDSLSRITGDAWCVHTVVDTLLFAPGHALFTLVAMAVVMFRLDPWLTLLAFAVAPFMGGAAWVFGQPLRAAARGRREIESQIQSHVQQTLTAVPVVQAFTREEHEERRFQEYAALAIQAHQRSAFVGSVYGLASGLLTTVATAAVLWFAALRVLEGRLTIGHTVVFLSYLRSLQAQLATFTTTYSTMQTAGASVDRVIEVLEDHEQVVERPGAAALPRVRGDVALDNVVFEYVPGRPVLQGVSITAQAGQTIAIVGASGAGKSTLVALIPRFFDPGGGRVTIDGHDLRDVQLRSVRDQVAVVLQEPFLFPLTVADNIRIGRPAATRSEIVAAATAANADEFIARLPLGYDTVIGERGATLSGGERQRVAIARALLKDAPILILDEPTSALDVETEQLLLDALDRLTRGRTTFVIAHRLSTIRNATRIVALDQGRVVEQGTHAELLARGGFYRRLHMLQHGTQPAGARAS